MGHHERSLLVLDSDSCPRKLHREPRMVFMEPHGNTRVSNYKLGQCCQNFTVNMELYQGRIHRFWKRVALYVYHHGWPTKNILGFRWSKKAKTTLETISFWQNISISIFKFSPFLYTMKACQWNLINFSKFANALIRKEKKHLCSSQWEKKNWEKLDFVL